MNGNSSCKLNYLHHKVSAFTADPDSPSHTPLRRATIVRTQETLGVIQEAVERYGVEAIALSYNGGKDCLVLLILFIAFLQSISKVPLRLNTVFVMAKDPFREVDEFVEDSVCRYNLDLARISGNMKDAFTEYLVTKSQIRAILVGTRRHDPHGEFLTFFDQTDRGWPEFMRVHPIIEWQYAEIWEFLRALEIPYCVLYDQGYTSLGGTKDTLRNPALQTDDRLFRPAYELLDEHKERLGRDFNREDERVGLRSGRTASM